MQNNFDAWVADTNQILTQIQEAKFEDRLEIGLQLANQVLGLITDEQLREPEDVLSEHLVNPPNAERQDSWFFNHPWMEGALAAFDLFDGDSIPVQAKFYWLKKKSSAVVAGSVHFTRNWEDFDYTRNAEHKVGIDFFLDPTASTLTLVLSDRGKLRVMDLYGRLTNTHLEVFKTWTKVNSAADQQTIHNLVWESLKLQSINSKFYFGVADAFTEMVTHLDKLGKPEEESKLFASRLMGRLIFVWFLRKMELISESQDYFNAESEDQGDYYRSKLEKLFFGVLNTPINERDSGDFINSDNSTPYLNGGLFSPKRDDWVADRELTFPPFFFHRLFEHFHQFNFTTDESTTEYEQVAIDPEMLGRVFESLLATQVEETGEQSRKAKGAFYTPREIVSYMCKESLRMYLSSLDPESKSHLSHISKLLDTSDQDWTLNGTNSLADIPKDARPKLDKALDQIRTLDPACGSGAYPIGMLQLLLKIKLRLNPGADRYQVKLNILQNNIFGSDIEPMAAEISRLRSWLSLIIEEKNSKSIEPLPNLDFNFVVANSVVPLVEEDLFSDPSLQERLNELRSKYFRATSPSAKSKIQKSYFDTIQPDLVDDQDERGAQLKSFNPFDAEVVADFFDSEYMFGIKAFDIVIGNPPYISHDSISLEKRILKKYQVFEPFADLYCYFYELGMEVLNEKTGVLTYITSNSFIKAEYGKPLRAFITKRGALAKLINVEETQLFDAAQVNTSIMFVSSTQPETVDIVSAVYDSKSLDFEDWAKSETHQIPSSRFTGSPWILADQETSDLLAKMQQQNRTLSSLGAFTRLGIATGKNEAFVIDASKRQEFLDEDAANESLIKPVLGGEDIDAYFYNSTKYLILTPNGVNVPRDYPSLMKHFESFDDKFRTRGAQGQHWTNLRAIAFLSEFKEEKIIWIELANRGRFAYSNEEIYLLNSAIFMKPPSGYSAKALTALLNSTPIYTYMRNVSQTIGSGNRWIKATVEAFPIPAVTIENKPTWSKLEDLVEQIMGFTPETIPQELITAIDAETCKLYELSPEQEELIHKIAKEQ